MVEHHSRRYADFTSSDVIDQHLDLVLTTSCVKLKWRAKEVMMKDIQTSAKLSYEEFLQWCDEDTRAEWVDGEVMSLTPVSRKHQEILGFLFAIINAFVETHQLGVVLTAPFQMKLEARPSGREPDLLFVKKERLDRLKDTYLDGSADLVVEIVSPESRLRDRGEKFAEYEAAGVREYWLIDPEERRADFYALGEDGRYERQHPEHVFHSMALEGFELNVPWLWQEPLPPMLKVLKSLKLIS